MKIAINAIGKINNNSPEANLIDNYLKRIPFNIKCNQIETKNFGSADKTKSFEGEALLKASSETKNFIICLDEQGKSLTSIEFATLINSQNQPISFIIGGANGLSSEVKAKADFLLSLGKMTLPHVLARVILIEQIYRAYTIKLNHPYHK
jgi:23S rRNA (pseudouridine1915-N3)-methyltransferase